MREPRREAGVGGVGVRGGILWIVALVVAGAMALRIGPLTEGIWYDEWCRTSGWLNAQNLDAILWHDVHNPLYNALMYVWIGVFGDSEISIRLPSVIMGFVSAGVFGAWAWRRFGRGVGVVVVLWLLTSPVHIWWSCEAKNVIFVAGWAMLAIVAFDELGRRPGWGLWMVATGVAVCAVWTDFVTLAAAVPAAMCAVGWRGQEGDIHEMVGEAGLRRAWWHDLRRGRWLIGSLAVCAVSVLPLAVFKARHSGELIRDYLHSFGGYEWAMLMLGHYLCGDAIFPESRQREYLAMALAIPVLVLLGRGWWRAARSVSGRASAVVFIGVPLIFLIATPVIEAVWRDDRHYIYQARNTIVMLGPFGLVLALGCWSLPRMRGRVGASVFFIVLNIAAAILMQTVYAERQTVMLPVLRYEKVAGLIMADVRNGGGGGRGGRAVRVFAKGHSQPLAYYAKEITANTSWGAAPEFEAIRESLRAGERVYFMDEPGFGVLAPEELQVLRSMARMVLVGRWGRVEVYRLEAGGERPG